LTSFFAILPVPDIPINVMIWIILIPLILLCSIVLSSYMKKKVQKPYKNEYQPAPTFLDDLNKKTPKSEFHGTIKLNRLDNEKR